MSEDYFIFTFVEEELDLLMKIIEHYTSIHHDRLDSCDMEILSQIYSRIYEKITRR